MTEIFADFAIIAFAVLFGLGVFLVVAELITRQVTVQERDEEEDWEDR